VGKGCQADERSRLGQSITLNHGVSQPMPNSSVSRSSAAPPLIMARLHPNCGARRGTSTSAAESAGSRPWHSAWQNFRGRQRPPDRVDLLFKDSIMARTATSTETVFATDRRHHFPWVEGVFRTRPFRQATEAETSPGMPKTWLSGSRFRKRIRMHRRSYFKYFLISVSIGTRCDHVGMGGAPLPWARPGPRRENDFERVGRLISAGTKTLR